MLEGIATAGEPVSDKFYPVLVDFDHTLFASNSTEWFISSAKPSWMAAVFDLLLRRAVPWKYVLGEAAPRFKDYICVAVIAILMPWTVLAWRRRAPGLFAEMQSALVERSLSNYDPGDVIIITFGMGFVVGALIARSRWSSSTLLATPLFASPSYFRKGKLDLAAMRLSKAMIGTALFVSDSEDDRDLLDAAKLGQMIVPQGEPIKAFNRLYFPLKYTAFVKYSLSYVIDQFFFVDCALWLLATWQSTSSLLVNLSVTPLLLLSLMCIYEIGYFDNDMDAALHERDPTLSGHEHAFLRYPITPSAWLWSLSLFAMAAAILGLSGEQAIESIWKLTFLWAVSMATVRLVFFCYNNSSIKLRIFLYPFLQSSKYLPIGVVLPFSFGGVGLIISQIMVMTANYVGYRLTGKKNFIDREIWRLLFFFCLVLIFMLERHSVYLCPYYVMVLMVFWLSGRALKSRMLASLRRRAASRPRTPIGPAR